MDGGVTESEVSVVYLILIGFASLACAALLDDIRIRQRNRELHERLSMLNEELLEADAQCVRYCATITHEREGRSCGSKKECGKCD